MASLVQPASSSIVYSCCTDQTNEQEKFVKDHVLTSILSGNLLIHTAFKSYRFEVGDIILLKKNQLVKSTKTPAQNSEFKSVSIYLEQNVIQDFALENKIEPVAPYHGESLLTLTRDQLYESYTSSLAAYQHGTANESLTKLKVKEALMLIMLLNKETSSLLFDFAEPGKIDLEQYMNTHYQFNVTTDRFAYLTGRSLATFKRDFTKQFNMPPNKWLQKKRLNEAYYLIKEKRRKVSEVYLEVGFEDLSHFSFAFKNEFGKAPTLI